MWYNNRDVTPFLEAIAKQFAFYHDRGIDMFKDGISVPGLSLLHLFNDLPNDTYFTVFNRTNSDLHELVKDNIVGGPAIIFHRYHEKNVTRIRGGSEPCRPEGPATVMVTKGTRGPAMTKGPGDRRRGPEGSRY